MRRLSKTLSTASVLLCTILAASLSWRFIPLQSWTPLFSGLLTALSLLTGAVLVRLARNAPITATAAFNDDDLRRFFDTLEELSSRLFWIFVQALTAMALVLFSTLMASANHLNVPFYDNISKVLSSLLSGSIIWIVWRTILVAKGDIGFVRLQRHILENALRREKVKEASKVVGGGIIKSSPGRFGGTGT